MLGQRQSRKVGDFGTPLVGACATGRLSVVKLLASKGANIWYVKQGKMYRAFRGATHLPEIRQWLLVGRYTEGPRLLLDRVAYEVYMNLLQS